MPIETLRGLVSLRLPQACLGLTRPALPVAYAHEHCARRPGFGKIFFSPVTAHANSTYPSRGSTYRVFSFT